MPSHVQTVNIPVITICVGNPVTIDGILVTDYLASPENLNECVDALVTSCEDSDGGRNPSYHYLGTKVLNKKEKAPQNNSTKEKRTRMTKEHDKLLQAEFSKGDETELWNKEKISKLASITGLTTMKIYKWNWDKNKKRAQ